MITIDQEIDNKKLLIRATTSIKLITLVNNLVLLTSNSRLKLLQNNENMDLRLTTLKKWLLPITTENIHTITNIVVDRNTSTQNSFKSFLTIYIELIAPYAKLLDLYDNPLEKDCLASGIVFFYGCIIYIIHFPNWWTYIEDIVLYNILYMTVDHYIDNNTLDKATKEITIQQMYILVQDPTKIDSMEVADPILKLIATTYQKLVTRCPNAKESIIKLFFAEIEGCDIQKQTSLDRDIYYNIALKKGGYTIQVLNEIVNNKDDSINKSSYHIGTIMQLIDDLLDVSIDRQNDIYTITTFDQDHCSDLDKLFLDVTDRIDKIDNRFTIFKILYAMFLVYVPTRSPNNYSKEILTFATSYNLFNFDASTLLVSAIKRQL